MIGGEEGVTAGDDESEFSAKPRSREEVRVVIDATHTARV